MERMMRDAELSALHRRVVNIVVQAIIGSRAGVHLERDRLLQVVEDRLPDLLDGVRLRLDPVLAALLHVPGVTEEGIYVGLVNLSVQLAQAGIELEPPQLHLDHQTRVQLLAEARAASPRLGVEDKLRGRIRQLQAERIGSLLVKEGLIDGTQLAEGLRAQRQLGGRLGTNLVERGCLTEQELAHFLSLQLGVPCVTQLEALDSDVQTNLPAELADRFRVVPVRRDGNELHLAMADPLDLEAIDAVAQVSGCQIFPIVAPELLIGIALERSYGLQRAPRVLEPPGTGSGGSVVDSTLDVPAFGARLALADSEARVLQLAQRFLSVRSQSSALLRKEGEDARAWSAVNAVVPSERLREIRRPWRLDPLLSALAESKAPRAGPAGEGLVAFVLGVSPENRVVVLPLVRGSELMGWAIAQDDERLRGAADRFVQMVKAALEILRLRSVLLAQAA